MQDKIRDQRDSVDYQHRVRNWSLTAWEFKVRNRCPSLCSALTKTGKWSWQQVLNNSVNNNIKQMCAGGGNRALLIMSPELRQPWEGYQRSTPDLGRSWTQCKCLQASYFIVSPVCMKLWICKHLVHSIDEKRANSVTLCGEKQTTGQLNNLPLKENVLLQVFLIISSFRYSFL